MTRQSRWSVPALGILGLEAAQLQIGRYRNSACGNALHLDQSACAEVAVSAHAVWLQDRRRMLHPLLHACRLQVVMLPLLYKRLLLRPC